MAQATGLLRRDARAYCWCRHPLAFLVEAADDISYCVIDVEDAFRAGEMRYAEIEPLYRGVVGDPAAWTKAGAIATDEKRVEYLRARTIDALVAEAAQAFAAREQAMLSGEFDDELIAVIPHAAALEAFRTLARERVYQSAVVLNLQSPGAAILGELLDALRRRGRGGRKRRARRRASARCWICFRVSFFPPTAGRRPICTRACSRSPISSPA